MRQQARAVVLMARANTKPNDEAKANTTASRARMVRADRQAGRQVQECGQARGQCQERKEGRMAEGQAAQAFIRNLFSRRNPSRQCAGGGGETAPVNALDPAFTHTGFLESFSLTSQQARREFHRLEHSPVLLVQWAVDVRRVVEQLEARPLVVKEAARKVVQFRLGKVAQILSSAFNRIASGRRDFYGSG